MTTDIIPENLMRNRDNTFIVRMPKEDSKKLLTNTIINGIKCTMEAHLHCNHLKGRIHMRL